MESQESSGAVLEIVQAGNPSEWKIEPDKPAEYPIVIRNETSEGHDVEIVVVDSVDWATVRPARISLAPGKETTAKLVLASGINAKAPAGQHSLTLELQDFEGTCLGQLSTKIFITPYYRLDMSLRARGPLLRRGVAEGFLLRCTVFNHGNAECTVHFTGDEDACVVFDAPSVQVPFGGNVSFDIEARWRATPLTSYPKSIRVRAEHPQGIVVSELPWQEVVASLGSLIPPLAEDTEFPDVVLLSDLHPKEASLPATSEIAQHADPVIVSSTPDRTPSQTPESLPEPLRVQISSPQKMKYTYGRRVNPWWPPAECFGGRWRVKFLPILMVIIVAAAIAYAKFAAVAPGSRTEAVSRINILTLLHLQPARSVRKLSTAQAGHARAKTSPKKQSRTRPNHAHHAAAPAVVSKKIPQRNISVAAGPVLPNAEARVPKGALWQGFVIHVSAGNIKVMNPNGDVRSFIVTQNFKSVFSANGTVAYPMTNVQPGTEVRIFYSYLFGLRHPNAIFILERPAQGK